jgi:tRNA threonylcarbamoyladenosine biosynthesis protein TsaE
MLSLPDPGATRRFATVLAKKLRRGDVLLLKGDLGAGKTTLAQGIVAALSPEPVTVTSPTFTLVQTYPVVLAAGAPCELWHYDLYRIEHPAQLEELGLDEAFATGVTLIEWPERLGNALPPQAVTVTLMIAPDGNTRRAVLSGESDMEYWRIEDATA